MPLLTGVGSWPATAPVLVGVLARLSWLILFPRCLKDTIERLPSDSKLISKTRSTIFVGTYEQGGT